jgi:hypothetical protein
MMDTQLQNSAIDFLILASSDSYGLGISTIELAQAVRGTTEGSLLRRFLVDSVCSFASSAWFIAAMERIPSDLLPEILATFAKVRDLGVDAVNPTVVFACTYHIHDDSNPKCQGYKDLGPDNNW